MALFYETRNLDNIAKLADNTKAAALKWHAFLVANNINILIYETIRTQEKQTEYVRQGASKTMKSYHLVGQALDFVPVDVEGKTLWSGYGAPDVQRAITEAKRLGFEWGGDWKSFVDKPHLQFNHRGYATDTFNRQPNAEVPKPVQAETGDPQIRKFQNWLNERYGAGLKVDGYYGPKTKVAALMALQKEEGVTADGKWGPKTKAAVDTVRLNAKGNRVTIAQGMFYCLGYDPNGIDGIFGKGTADAALRFQKAHKLVQDSIIGKNTWEKLFA